jgi:hypothetical protein
VRQINFGFDWFGAWRDLLWVPLGFFVLRVSPATTPSHPRLGCVITFSFTDSPGVLLYVWRKLMIRKTCLEKCGRTASVAVVSLFTAFLGNAVHAQTAQSVMGAPIVRPATPPAFLVAPSVSLGYSPTAIASGHLTSSGKLDLQRRNHYRIHRAWTRDLRFRH